MGCGCAKRARTLLSAMGYTHDEHTGLWTSPVGDTVSDDDVEQHHTKVTVHAVTKTVAVQAKKLAQALG